ncbi:hypothetical protein WJX73_006342 [Symbiochloris irregularis]|uniref:Uncharacterized protein n=1 Tax=Symbiochloris irregularis TaxID=706552 RepID=A0AAW1P2D2_9CHLO
MSKTLNRICNLGPSRVPARADLLSHVPSLPLLTMADDLVKIGLGVLAAIGAVVIYKVIKNDDSLEGAAKDVKGSIKGGYKDLKGEAKSATH